MATTLPQIGSNTSTTPVNGQAWNFKPLLDSYLIPSVIAQDEKLPPGARLLWGVLRRYCFRDGQCFASDERLARALAVSPRQFRRYVRALVTAGLLRSTDRPGKAPVRELLWDARFAGKLPEPRTDMSREVDIYVQGGGHICPPYIRNKGVLKGVLKGTNAAALKSASPNPEPPPPEKPASEWNEEDYRRRGRERGFPEHVIERDIERVRARRAKPTAERLVKPAELAPEVVAAIRR